jgi:hypothetical protein
MESIQKQINREIKISIYAYISFKGKPNYPRPEQGGAFCG